MVSTEATTNRELVNEEDSKEKSRLCLFEVNISIDIYYGCLDYRHFSVNDYTFDRRCM